MGLLSSKGQAELILHANKPVECHIPIPGNEKLIRGDQGVLLW